MDFIMMELFEDDDEQELLACCNNFVFLSLFQRATIIQKKMNRLLKKWQRRVRHKKTGIPLELQQRKAKRKHGHSINVAKFGGFKLYEETGLFYDEFERLFLKVKDELCKPRRKGQPTSNHLHCGRTILTPRSRLVLALNWLRDGGLHRRLQRSYQVSRATVCREVHHVLPILYSALNEIQLPLQWPVYHFEMVAGAIDCTSHYRCRVHPGQALYYRGDKHGHFLSAQVVCTLDGEILDVQLLLGHNNDKACYKLSGIRVLLHQNGIRLLADDGYSDCMLVTPTYRNNRRWQQAQKDHRSIVEVAIGMVQNFRFAREKARQSPAVQAMALLVCYQLTNIYLKKYPLRHVQKATIEAS
ncbi:DDE Tnp4 domain-containing protein [Balamuthia mandrillaris]